MKYADDKSRLLNHEKSIDRKSSNKKREKDSVWCKDGFPCGDFWLKSPPSNGNKTNTYPIFLCLLARRFFVWVVFVWRI